MQMERRLIAESTKKTQDREYAKGLREQVRGSLSFRQ